MRLLLFLFFIGSLLGCQKEQKISETNQDIHTHFITNVDDARLRTAPSLDATASISLPRGTELLAMGEVSDTTMQLKLRGITFDEPWLRVRTKEGTEGWIYGGMLSFAMEESSELASRLMQKRLQTFFGEVLSTRIRSYQQQYHDVQSAADLAMLYRAGLALRDTLVSIMEKKIEVGSMDELPDLFWLEQTMPGFETQLVAEGTAYYLFWNYKDLAQQAKTTQAPEDDAFMDLQISLFPDDSIEYFYPAWFLQTWDYGGHSLLGRGIHFATLQKIDQLLKKSDLFTPELIALKARLVNDIVAPYVTYWETKERIQAELDTILLSNFSNLTKADNIALQMRRQQFETPDSSKIEVNHQSGTYN